MAEKPSDFNMPSSVVTKLVRDTLPAGVTMTSDALSCISRAASIYVLYATTCANEVSQQHNRRTLTAQDIIEGISRMGFDNQIPQLIEWHDTYRKLKANKIKLKTSKANDSRKHNSSSQSHTNKSTDGEDNDDDIISDLVDDNDADSDDSDSD